MPLPVFIAPMKFFYWFSAHQWTGRTVWVLPVLCLLLLTGCSDMVLLDPKGPIGETERFVILFAFCLMLLVVIPVIVMVLWFPWRYRANHARDDYAPKWSYSGKIELIIWLIPAAIVTTLSILIWQTTHQLDPYKPITSSALPVNVQAVSLDWQWLFIYPDENIAVVNELVFPVNVPLALLLTSETVMTSFFIPQLGSQIYAMAGMQTRLHLLASETGSYAGQNQQFSGDGYAAMKFRAIAATPSEYAVFLKKSREAGRQLDMARYEKLTEPTIDAPVTYFSSVEPGLFATIIRRFSHSHNHNRAAVNSKKAGIPEHHMISKDN